MGTGGFARTAAWLALAGVAFAAGRYGPRPEATAPGGPLPPGSFDYFIQDAGPQPDPRELLPLPDPEAPGRSGPGAPQQGMPEAGQCPLYFFQDGQLYELQPGDEGAPGPFGGSPELFPLEPAPGAPARPDRPETPGDRPAPEAPRPEPRQAPPEPPPYFRRPGMAEGPAAPAPASSLTHVRGPSVPGTPAAVLSPPAWTEYR